MLFKKNVRQSILWLYAQIVKKMRQLITSNVVNFVIKKHNRKRRETFVNTIKERGTVCPVTDQAYVNTRDANARVSNVKVLPRTQRVQHQNHQRNRHWLDSSIMRNLVLDQW